MNRIHAISNTNRFQQKNRNRIPDFGFRIFQYRDVLRVSESPEIGKGSWPGTAELAAAQPTVHVNLNVTTPRVAYKSPLSLYHL